MKIIDPTQIHKHSPEILALAKNRSSAGLRLDVKTAAAAHAAASAAQQSLIAIIRAETWKTMDAAATADKYKMIAEVIDRNERDAHHRLTQLRQAVAAATEAETGIPHWFGWHADDRESFSNPRSVTLGVRQL